MQTRAVQLPSATLACEQYGEGEVRLVIEMGLGASMAEWRRLAVMLAERYTVLLYHRAGYGNSTPSTLARTPESIAAELHLLLEQLGCARKITILAHSQGGLYAWKFARMYPELVERLVLLDPLSPRDDRFRRELTAEEFRKSGVDKTAGLRLNLRLCRLHLGALVRRMMRKAPPFYYYDGFSEAETAEILSGLGRTQTYETALAEYAAAHDAGALAGLLDAADRLDVPVVLITHSSAIAEREIREFGGASEAQARKIEALWQEIMQGYLACTTEGTLLRAEHSSHSIHLTDPEQICEAFQ
ncbi:MAG: alpha/beta fold hydrolase [Aristaeellaceae bacterium]